MARDNLTLLSENEVHLIYLKENPKQNSQTIVKRLNSPFPADDLIAQLKNEYVTTKDLGIPGIRKPLAFKEEAGNYNLELEYIEGTTLKELSASKAISQFDIVKIAINVCDILGQLHHAGWVHCSIGGSTIIINPQTKEPTIIDASLMSRSNMKATSQLNTEKLRRILPYISPEQTGRMNRALDLRTDFYSLGATLYECLVGKKPYDHSDSLEMIYAHLTKVPKPPIDVDSNIPQCLSDIIIKLLSKNAEDRYQSAYGLKYDLERLADHWDQRQELAFPLCEKDFSETLQIPQKLYGRETDLETLLSDLQISLSGGRRAILITGESGTGKSAIVQEVRKPITESRGYFVQGKFDLFARNIPYLAWIEIFKDFINQLITEDEQEIREWEALLTNTLGDGAGVLADLIPNLKHIIRNIPSVEELGVTESQNRLNDILYKFFKAIATEDHPLTIFVDDLQWADRASLNLFKSLLTDDDNKFLLFIGAFRSDEMKHTDPLMLKIDEIEKAGTEFSNIKLTNLNAESINQLISDTLFTEKSETEELAQEILNKTKGNPYFIYQFIKCLYEDGLVKFNFPQSVKTRKPVWDWEINDIHSTVISGNVVEFLVNKIVQLPDDVLATLKSAACIGNTFNLRSLEAVRNEGSTEIAQQLEHAIGFGYIFYKNLNQTHLVHDGMDIVYQFAHDKVQQAVHSLILEEERHQTHFEIGKLLYTSQQDENNDEQIFELVFHLNFGKGLVLDPKDTKWIAQMNLRAGREAKKIIAFDSAFDFLVIATDLTGDGIWEDDPEFALELGEEYLDCAYLTNRFDEAEDYFKYLISKVPDKVKKADLHFRQMVQYQHLGKIDNILDTGLAGLELLGLKFSPKVSKLAVLFELVKTFFMIRKMTYEDWTTLPEMTDRPSRIAMSLFNKSLTFAYDRSEELMAILGMRMLNLTLKKGNHDLSAPGFMTYGGILSVGFADYKSGLKFCEIAIKSSERTGNKSAISMAHFGYGMTTFALVPLGKALEEFHKSVEIALEGGAHTDAAPSTMYFFYLNYMLGMRLNELEQIVHDNLNFTKQINTENFHLALLAGLGVIHDLKEGKETNIIGIKGKELSPEEIEQKLLSTEHKSIRIYSRIFQMQNHILFDDVAAARVCEQEIIGSLNVTLGTVLGPQFDFWRALMHTGGLTTSDTEVTRHAKKIIHQVTKKIGKLASLSPENFRHWHLLLQAESFRISGRYQQAQKHYDEAIEASMNGNYLQYVAIAGLLCAKFNSTINNSEIAGYYFNKAIRAFNSWGATALAKFISQNVKTDIVQNGPSLQSAHLDQESLINLSQTISEEIELSKLIRRLMQIFIRNAGAEKAILIMHNDGEWFIEAEQEKDGQANLIKDIRIHETQKLHGKPILSTNVCKYVIRTEETVIISEATQDSRFSKSEYISTYRPRSIMCLPLIKQGSLKGLVYLENNVMKGAFNTDRANLLNYISSQIAISIENAKLYSGISELSKAYEKFVSKEFLEILGKKSITEVKLGDQVQRDMTVLFADIRNFTGVSEKMDPADNFKFINEYLSRMVPIIRKYNGFVDKYIGDEIMALFPTSADDAIQCGIAMRHELKVYGDQLQKRGLARIEIGIGLNTGSLMLGTVGGEDRMNSTVISDAVNIASRIESSTKKYGAPFMITKETYDNLKKPGKYAIRKMGFVTYSGKSKPSMVFEIFDGDDLDSMRLKKESLEKFETAVEHFSKNEYHDALLIFNNIIKSNPNDEAATVYIKRTVSQLNNLLQEPKT